MKIQGRPQCECPPPSMSPATVPLAVVPSNAVALASPRFHLGYRPWLDGLRGVAILMVFTFHASSSLLPRGHLGVDLFFVLSGFLITVVLLQDHDHASGIDFKRFYARRILRLAPALLVFLGAITLLMRLWPHIFGDEYISPLYALFYVMNWILAFRLDYVSPVLYHTWSLSVEEQFYLVWPVVLSLCLWLRVRTMTLLICLGGLVLIVAVHRYALLLSGATDDRVSVASDTRISGLLLGCLIGVLTTRGLLPGRTRLLTWTTALLAPACLLYLCGWWERFGLALTVAELFFASVLVLMLVQPPKALTSVLENPVLTWLGQISYGLYLWHLPMGFVAQELTESAVLRLPLS